MSEQTEQLPKKNGGARPNSGPKLGAKYKKTIAREAATLRLTKRIEEKIDELADALIAKGLEGDIPAIREAFERGLGKVVEKRHYEIRNQPPLDEQQADNGIQEDKDING